MKLLAVSDFGKLMELLEKFPPPIEPPEHDRSYEDLEPSYEEILRIEEDKNEEGDKPFDLITCFHCKKEFSILEESTKWISGDPECPHCKQLPGDNHRE